MFVHLFLERNEPWWAAYCLVSGVIMLVAFFEGLQAQRRPTSQVDPTACAPRPGRLLARHSDFTCVGESHDLVEVCRDAATLQPDLILLDWHLRGLRANRLSVVRSACPSASVVVLSTHDDERTTAIREGAAAFVCKAESPAHLLTMLRAAGGRPVVELACAIGQRCGAPRSRVRREFRRRVDACE